MEIEWGRRPEALEDQGVGPEDSKTLKKTAARRRGSFRTTAAAAERVVVFLSRDKKW